MLKKAFKPIALFLVFFMSQNAFALAPVKTQTVYLDSSWTTDVILGNDTVHSDQPANQMVHSDVQMAINGGFFNAYYDKTQPVSYPDNVPRLYGGVIKNGYVVNSAYTSNMIGFTYDGKSVVDRVTCSVYYMVNDTRKTDIWSVDVLSDYPNASYILTSDYNKAVTLPAGASAFTVIDGVVAYEGAPEYIADNSFIVVNNSSKPNLAINDKVEISQSISTVGGSDWRNVKSSVSGGRILIRDGVNVSRDTKYNGQYDGEINQTMDYVATRAFAYTKADGTLNFASVSGNFTEIADYLMELGAIDCLSLDGGGSTMLYGKDSGFVVPAGRELTSILAVVPAAAGTVISNIPADWALEYINQADDLKILPNALKSKYTSMLTRADLCKILYEFIPAKSWKSIENFMIEKGVSRDNVWLDDTDSYYIKDLIALGVVEKSTESGFSPNELVTREELAVILKRVADLTGTVSLGETYTFSDEENISWWAMEGVKFTTACNLMDVMADYKFEPSLNLTREQAIVTMVNAFNIIDGGH